MAKLDRGIIRLQSLAKISRVFVWLFIAAVVFAMLTTFVVMTREMRLADPPMAIIAITGLAGLLYCAAFLLSLIPVALWIYRAHANLRRGGVFELAYTPGWAIGSFFVPLVNLVVPMKAMRELHNRSMGGLPEWSQSSVASVASWWACHIAAVLLWLFLTFTMLINVLTNVHFTTPPAATSALTIVMLLLLAGSAWFLRRIINEVTEAQSNGTFAATVFE